MVPGPAAGEIHVFGFDLDVSDAEREMLSGFLSPEENDRAARYRFDRDRNRFIVRRAVLRSVLSSYVDVSPAGIEFGENAYGKPELGSDFPFFNATHSGDIGLVATRRDADIGVDLEFLRAMKDLMSVADDVFSPDEILNLYPADNAKGETLSPQHQLQRFFSYWTRKEAVVKSLGRGLSQSLRSFTLSPPQSLKAAPEQVSIGVDGGMDLQWVLALSNPCEGAYAAVATPLKPAVVRCWHLVSTG
jgi:4'-phosphopantetheinyl transferase